MVVKEPNLSETTEQMKTKLQQVIQKGALEIEAKAKARCPVDTGNLRNSIHTEIGDLEAEIGTSTEYAPYVEYGTIYQPPHPFLIPSAEDVWNNKIKSALLSGFGL